MKAPGKINNLEGVDRVVIRIGKGEWEASWKLLCAQFN
jgi:hypothetical protein